ncbi:MAG: hypothetical protein QW589_04565 [Candidatus Bathyarchaeia archaeon]
MLKNVVELVKKLKHGKISKLFCPICQSEIIKHFSPYDGWFFPARYVCLDCGYIGTLVLVKE